MKTPAEILAEMFANVPANEPIQAGGGRIPPEGVPEATAPDKTPSEMLSEMFRDEAAVIAAEADNAKGLPYVTDPATWCRKPNTIQEAYGLTFGNDAGDGFISHPVPPGPSFIEATITLTEQEFDALCDSFLVDRADIAGKGGHDEQGNNFSTLFCAPNRPHLLVNPEGHNYCRYVGLFDKDKDTWAKLLKVEPPKIAAEDKASQLEDGLAGFYGSAQFFKWSILFKNSVLTEGTKYLADKAGCYWLMDLIGSAQLIDKVKHQPFQCWFVQVCEAEPPPKPWTGPEGEITECSARYAWVWCEDGRENDKTSVKYEQFVPYTDFPLARVKQPLAAPSTLRSQERQQRAFKLYACENELGGITIMLPTEY